MSCSCNGRVETVGGPGALFAGAAGAVGGIFKAAMPVLLPPLVGIGVNWAVGKIGGGPSKQQPAVPEPVRQTATEVREQRDSESSSITIGTVVLGAIALAFLMR